MRREKRMKRGDLQLIFLLPPLQCPEIGHSHQTNDDNSKRGRKNSQKGSRQREFSFLFFSLIFDVIVNVGAGQDLVTKHLSFCACTNPIFESEGFCCARQVFTSQKEKKRREFNAEMLFPLKWMRQLKKRVGWQKRNERKFILSPFFAKKKEIRKEMKISRWLNKVKRLLIKQQVNELTGSGDVQLQAFYFFILASQWFISSTL